MVITDNIELPTDHELNVEEINLTFSVLQAAAFHLGKYCELKNNEFMLCKYEEGDPRRCINEGKAVTACSLDFFQQLKKHCKEEFNQYYNCIDKSSATSSFSPCRKTQTVFDECVLNSLKIERPSIGYFCEVKVHDTNRAKPKYNVIEYPDAVAPVQTQKELPPAKYSSRNQWVS